LRLQGREVYDINGLPRDVNGVLQYSPMAPLQRILDNPQTGFLLFLDEVNRAPSEMESVLFKLFDRIIVDTKVSNMFVVAAINDDDEDESINFKLTNPALKSRSIFVNFMPQKNDISDYIKLKKYNKYIQYAMETLMNTTEENHVSKLLDYDVPVNSFEQITTLRSYEKWNTRLQRLKFKSLREIKNDFKTSSTLFFSDMQAAAIYGILDTFVDLNSFAEAVASSKIPEFLKNASLGQVLEVIDSIANSDYTPVLIKTIKYEIHEILPRFNGKEKMTILEKLESINKQ